jgi:CheY-like chemotaxis protein
MKKLLLLVDDDKDDHDFFNYQLNAFRPDITVVSAFNGEEGLKMLKIIYPDWIFLDINMPKINGIEVLRQIKLSEDLNDIPVYIFSTSDGNRSRKIALSLGAIDYFKKPSSLNGFKEIFKKVFN